MSKAETLPLILNQDHLESLHECAAKVRSTSTTVIVDKLALTALLHDFAKLAAYVASIAPNKLPDSYT